MSAPSAAMQFYGRDDQFTHALKYGPGLVTGVAIQWQNGKQVCVWPNDKANAKMNSRPSSSCLTRAKADRAAASEPTAIAVVGFQRRQQHTAAGAGG